MTANKTMNKFFTNIKKLERKIAKLEPVKQSIAASWVWWHSADHYPVADLAGIKSMMKWRNEHDSPETVEDALIAIGVSHDEAAKQVKSLRTLNNLKA